MHIRGLTIQVNTNRRELPERVVNPKAEMTLGDVFKIIEEEHAKAQDIGEAPTSTTLVVLWGQ